MPLITPIDLPPEPADTLIYDVKITDEIDPGVIQVPASGGSTVRAIQVRAPQYRKTIRFVISTMGTVPQVIPSTPTNPNYVLDDESVTMSAKVNPDGSLTYLLEGYYAYLRKT